MPFGIYSGKDVIKPKRRFVRLVWRQVRRRFRDVHFDDDPPIRRLREGRQGAGQIDVAAARLGPNGKLLTGRLVVCRTGGLGLSLAEHLRLFAAGTLAHPGADKDGSGASDSRHDPLAAAQDRGFDHRQRASGVCPVGQRVRPQGAL